MEQRSWEDDIKKLLKLQSDGCLNETDMDEVAEHHKTTRDEVMSCLTSEIDMKEKYNCLKCGKVISIDEASAHNSLCEECDKED